MDEQKYLETLNYRAEMYLTGLTTPKNVELPQNVQKAIEAAEPLAPGELKRLVLEKREFAADILFQIPETVQVGCFVVKNEAIRQNLSQKATRLAEGIQNIITQIATKKAQMVTNLYVALCRRLSRKPRNIEECC